MEWKRNSLDIELIETDIPTGSKIIKLRDDHGKDMLETLGKRLCKSPYVKAIINSLPFNPKEKNIIRKVSATGIIEVVLVNTDKGIGLVIETTGRNMKETQKIADILKEKYFV